MNQRPHLDPRAGDAGGGLSSSHDPANGIKLAIAWAVVGIPLLWGVSQTAANAAKLFGH